MENGEAARNGGSALGTGRVPEVANATEAFWSELSITLDDLESLVASSRERIESLTAQVAERDDQIASLRSRIATLEAQLRSSAAVIIPMVETNSSGGRATVGAAADSGIWRRLKRLEGR